MNTLRPVSWAICVRIQAHVRALILKRFIRRICYTFTTSSLSKEPRVFLVRFYPRSNLLTVDSLFTLHCPSFIGHGFNFTRLNHTLKLNFPVPYLTLTNQNSIQDEIKSRLKLGNACYYSVQNLLSSSLLSKKLKIKIYRTITLPVVLYGCETWSLTLREERRLRVRVHVTVHH